MEKTEIIEVSKRQVFTRIKKFFKRIMKRETIIITLFFFLCYLSMELLNGHEIVIEKIFNFSIPFNEKLLITKNAIYSIFKFPKFICNYLIIVFSYLILKGVTNRTKLSCTIVASVTILFSIINYFVTQIRGISITISDIYAIQTALNVAKGIRPNINPNFVFGIILFIIGNFIIWRYLKLDKDQKNNKKSYRVLSMLIGFLGIFSIFTSDTIMNKVAIWDINESYSVSGAGLTIMRLAKDLKVKTPKNYNSNEIYEILSKYEDDTKDYSDELPNVVVVMNESFADLSNIYNFDTLHDNLPFYHELINQENVISGIMHSSQYGGGTANVEYEFLTQNTTAFLPTGSTTYQQYISKPVNQSIVRYMNNLNYDSYGIHSWYKNGYSRGKVYKLLGFRKSMFYEDMPDLTVDFTGYSSDWSTYTYLYDLLRNKEQDKRNFTFLLTVQNHLPYVNTDEEGIQFVEDNKELNSYLQYEFRSDMALSLLTNFLKNYDEKTILLFFGDHQPSLHLESSYKINGLYDNEEAPYIVPFLIWANYDIEEKSGIETSTNYLQNILFDAANMPKDPYTKYINELRKEIPVITTQYYKDKEGNRYNINDENSPYYDKLQEYWRMIYYQLFEKNS